MRTILWTLALAACGTPDDGDDDTDAIDTEVVDTDDTDVVDTDVATTWDPDGDGCPDALADASDWQVDACGHLFLQLAPAAGRLRVFARPTLDASTYAPDASYVFAAPDEDAVVTMERGPWVEEPGCDDVLEQDPVVLETWTSTQGTITVTVDTTADVVEPWGERLTTGTIALEGFVLESATTGATCTLPDVTVATSWGWMAG